MSVQTILDDTNHIKPEYIQDGNYGFVKNPLESPLYCFNPAQAVAHPIVDASYVSAANIKTDQIDQLPGSLLNEIRVTTDLEMATARRLKFQANGEITCVTTLTVDAPTATNFNGDIELYKTLPTIKLNDTSTPGLLGGTITYDTSQRLKLTSEQTTPFVGGGQVTADGSFCRTVLDSYADDGTAVRHILVTTDALNKTATIGGNGGGNYTGITIECNPGIEAVATSIQGQEVLKVNPNGNVAIGSAVADGSLFLITTTSLYGGMNINGGVNELTIFSSGGDIVTTNPLRPSAGIQDTAASIGSAGQFLAKDGANSLLWTTATPGTWTGAATSDLDMNQFKIIDVPTISMFDSLTDNPTIEFQTGAGTALIRGNNAGSYTNMTIESAQQLQVWTGAIEGVQMGTGTTVGSENYFRGMGQPLRLAQDTGKEATDYILFDTIGDGSGGFVIENTEYVDVNSGKSFRVNANENVELSSGAGGQFTIMTGGATINCDDGISLNAIGGNVYIQAPDGASYANPELTAVRTLEYERIPSMIIAVPFSYSDKIGGGYTIDATNPPLSPMITTPSLTWAYSGKLTGLNTLSRFTTAGYVEVIMSGVLSDVNADLAWSIELHDLTAGNRYISDLGTWGFNQSTAATDTSYTTSSRKGVNGLYVSVPTLRTVFDVSALSPQIPDGNQVCFNIYVIATSGSYPIGEFRWSVSVRPVNQFATW